ncbi:MAG TPA: SHOCT domain-containing protein [Candidatus Limnocylindrales bacterium]|jgi:hypothetical protein
MVLIMGWGGGQAKDLGPVAPATCPNCHNAVYLHHVRSNKQFSLYFVPLASYGGNEYLACPICQHAMQVPPGQQERIVNMRAATASFRQGHVPEAYYLQTVEAFWRAIGVNPSGQQVLHGPADVLPPPAPPADDTASEGPSLAEQLHNLGELRQQGVLTDEEFTAAKKRVLEG